MFALAVGEVALQFGTLASAHLTVFNALPAYAHLLLALSLVAASWVGWSNSRAPGNRLPVTGIFTWAFVVLLVDVMLVVFYFIVARGVDLKTTTTGQISLDASAEKETFWVMMVFGVYAFWDVVTKAVVVPAGRKARSYWKRGKVSLVCLVLAFVIWAFLRSVPSQMAVTFTDLALISLVFLFRALKDSVLDDKGTRTSGTRWAIILCLALVAFAVAAWAMDRF